MRVKLVIMMRMAGASDRTVSRMTICMADEKFSRLVRSGSWPKAAAEAPGEADVPPAEGAAGASPAGGVTTVGMAAPPVVPTTLPAADAPPGVTTAGTGADNAASDPA